MMTDYQYVKSQSLELVVAGVAGGGSTQRRPLFENQPFLNTRNLLSLEFYSLNDLTLSPLGNPLFDSAVINNAYLVLYGSDPDKPGSQGTWLNNIPLWSMHRINNGTDPYVFQLYTLAPRLIIWEQSYIQLSGNPGNTVATSFLFTVGYQGLDATGNS